MVDADLSVRCRVRDLNAIAIRVPLADVLAWWVTAPGLKPHRRPQLGAPPSAVLDPLASLRDDLTPGRYITAGEAIERAYRAPETYVLDVGTWARTFRAAHASYAALRRDARRAIRRHAHRSTRP